MRNTSAKADFNKRSGELEDSFNVMFARRAELTGQGPAAQAFNRMQKRAAGNETLEAYVAKVRGVEASAPRATTCAFGM